MQSDAGCFLHQTCTQAELALPLGSKPNCIRPAERFASNAMRFTLRIVFCPQSSIPAPCPIIALECRANYVRRQLSPRTPHRACASSWAARCRQPAALPASAHTTACGKVSKHVKELRRAPSNSL